MILTVKTPNRKRWALFSRRVHAARRAGNGARPRCPCPLGEDRCVRALDAGRDTPYNREVIKSFKDNETEKVYCRLYSKRLPRVMQPAALRKLRMLNNAHGLQDLQSPPGNRLEALQGQRKGCYSIRINDQCRICFAWREGRAYDAEIVDYH